MLTKSAYSRVEPYTQRATRGTESDSGDEGVEDDEIPSVFTVEELTLFQRDLESLHNRSRQAKLVNFQNAYGKFFYQKLFQFLLPDTTLFACLSSTQEIFNLVQCDSSGSLQVGTCGVGQVGQLAAAWCCSTKKE